MMRPSGVVDGLAPPPSDFGVVRVKLSPHVAVVVPSADGEVLVPLHGYAQPGDLPDRAVKLRHLFIESSSYRVTPQTVRALLRFRDWVSTARNASFNATRLIAEGILISDQENHVWEIRRRLGYNTAYFKLWGGLGDVLMTTPVFRTIKQRSPDTEIRCFAIGATDRDMLATSPHVASVSLRAGFANETREAHALVFEPAYGRLSPTSWSHRNAAHTIGECCGITIDDEAPEVFLTPDEERFGIQLRRKHGDYIAIHTTSCRVQKDWAREHWEVLVQALSKWPVLQVGGRADVQIRGARDHRGLAIRHALAIVKWAKAFIGVDSVMQHAAAAFRLPTVVLFGPSPPDVFGHRPAINIAAPRCACYRDVGRWTVCDRNCMRQIEPHAVAEVVASLCETST